MYKCFYNLLLVSTASIQSMDYGRGTMVLPLYGEYDIKPSIGNQPLSLTGIAEPGGEILYDLRIWHESLHASD